jgi:hypothetical protein
VHEKDPLSSEKFKALQRFTTLESNYLARQQNMWIEKATKQRNDKKPSSSVSVFVQLLKTKDFFSLEKLVAERRQLKEEDIEKLMMQLLRLLAQLRRHQLLTLQVELRDL